ncbi:hypothetical protein A33M_1707 [Rhodovulum sp. PH10]|uniref:head-tail adaptor protein n=1 Tax=Rhodovulum sp. PH10 TaxID=1187851 RepID=UPI00027C24AF|nr:head-tail adaptor protein [Rhodovulum sp. PH10]EJW12737.1 hypothetical protein A33M_1707 [Rhodovulum sp. PH10]
MPAGDLRERVRFEARAVGDDGYGNVRADWIERFSVSARIVSLRGGESVIAARLQGTQPVVITVRAEARTRAIATDWRAVDARRGTVYAIRGAVEREGRDYIDLTCEAGVAA